MGGSSLSHGTYSQGGFWLGLKDLLPECGCQPGPGCGWGLGRAMSSGSSSYGLPTWPGLPYSTGLGAKELLSDPRRRGWEPRGCSVTHAGGAGSQGDAQ